MKLPMQLVYVSACLYLCVTIVTTTGNNTYIDRVAKL